MTIKTLSAKEIQDELFKLLIRVDTIFRENNVTYFMGFGTLLGAVRHGGFIPWDDDIDIIVPKQELRRAQEILSKHLPHYYSVISLRNGTLAWDVDFRVRDNRTVLDNETQTLDSGIYIDIIEMPEIGSRNRLNYVKLKKLRRKVHSNQSPFIKKVVSFLPYCMISFVFSINELRSREKFLIVSDKLSGGMYKSEDVFPLIELVFQNRSFYAPNDYKKVLTDMYGNYMELPPESERKQHFQDCYLKI